MLTYRLDDNNKINKLVFNLSSTDVLSQNRLKNYVGSKNTTGMLYFLGEKDKYRKEAENFIHDNAPFYFNKDKTLEFLDELIELFSKPQYLSIKPNLRIDVFKSIVDLLDGKEIPFRYELNKYLKYERGSKEAANFKKLMYGDFTQIILEKNEIYLSINKETSTNKLVERVKNEEDIVLEEIEKSLADKLRTANKQDKTKLIKINQLLKICRPINFRKIIIEAAAGVSEVNIDGHLDNELPLLEAAHIVSVKKIVKYVDQEISIKRDIPQEVVNNLEFLTSSANGMLIPFNYHKLFDNGYIKFSPKDRKFIPTNPKRKEIIEFYGVSMDHEITKECLNRTKKAFEFLEKLTLQNE
ncbi:MAG: HNH endonuclease [Metamycoplasmataceae bacterium]